MYNKSHEPTRAVGTHESWKLSLTTQLYSGQLWSLAVEAQTGQVVNKNEAQEYCQMHGIRIISTRWVVVNKHDAIKGDIVRSRLVCP